MTNKKTPERIVTKEGAKMCGCYVIEYSDETSELSPCPPCGFGEVARGLNSAAQAMAAVATALREERKRALMGNAVKGIIKP